MFSGRESGRVVEAGFADARDDVVVVAWFGEEGSKFGEIGIVGRSDGLGVVGVHSHRGFDFYPVGDVQWFRWMIVIPSRRRRTDLVTKMSAHRFQKTDISLRLLDGGGRRNDRGDIGRGRGGMMEDAQWGCCFGVQIGWESGLEGGRGEVGIVEDGNEIWMEEVAVHVYQGRMGRLEFVGTAAAAGAAVGGLAMRGLGIHF